MLVGETNRNVKCLRLKRGCTLLDRQCCTGPSQLLSKKVKFTFETVIDTITDLKNRIRIKRIVLPNHHAIFIFRCSSKPLCA